MRHCLLSSDVRIEQSVCRRGLTLLEVAVVIGVISLLLAVSLPALQRTRESARKTSCQAHLKSLAQAVIAYEAVHRAYPQGAHKTQLLPYLDQQPLFHQIL